MLNAWRCSLQTSPPSPSLLKIIKHIDDNLHSLDGGPKLTHGLNSLKKVRHCVREAAAINTVLKAGCLLISAHFFVVWRSELVYARWRVGDPMQATSILETFKGAICNERLIGNGYAMFLAVVAC